MNQTELLDYVSQHLPAELQLMQTGGYGIAHPELTPQEKALIYYYTATGSTSINRGLHTSQPDTLTQQLALVVQKMPVYEGSAYSAAHLSPALLSDLYAASLTGDTALTAGAITWPAFLSASRSLRVARRHLDYTSPPTPHNCLFVLNSLQGRAIELLSRYGPNGRDPLMGNRKSYFYQIQHFGLRGRILQLPAR